MFDIIYIKVHIFYYCVWNVTRLFIPNGVGWWVVIPFPVRNLCVCCGKYWFVFYFVWLWFFGPCFGVFVVGGLLGVMRDDFICFLFIMASFLFYRMHI